MCAQGRLAEGIPHLERALALDPTLADATALLGEAYASKRQFLSARTYLLRAIQAEPDNPILLRRAAWLLATAPEDEARDGVKAMELAKRAERLTAGRDPITLEALGAAYAEQNQWTDAIATLRRALAVAGAQGYGDFVPQLQRDLAVCERGGKLRE